MGPRTFFLLLITGFGLLIGAGDFMVDPRPPLHVGNYVALVVGGAALAALLGSWVTGHHRE